MEPSSKMMFIWGNRSGHICSTSTISP